MVPRIRKISRVSIQYIIPMAWGGNAKAMPTNKAKCSSVDQLMAARTRNYCRVFYSSGSQRFTHLLTTIVARDTKIDMAQRGISVGKSDNWNVDIGALSDGLVVSPWIGDQKHARLHERILDLIGQRTRSEPAVNILSPCVLRKLENGTLTVGTGTNSTDIGRVFNGNNHTGRQHQLLPGHVEIENVDTILPSGIHVSRHGLLQIFGSQVNLASQKLANIIFSWVEYWPPCSKENSKSYSQSYLPQRSYSYLIFDPKAQSTASIGRILLLSYRKYSKINKNLEKRKYLSTFGRN